MAASQMSSRERIADLTQVITSLVHWNRTISSDLQRPQRVQNEIDRDLATIKACQDRITRAQANLANGPAQMEANDARILQLRNEITLEENKLKIERLLELVEKINDFDGAVAACDAAPSDDDAPVEVDSSTDNPLPDSEYDSEYDPTDEEIGDDDNG